MTLARERPTRSATAACVSPKSSRLAVGGRLLQRREVGAHDILDQRQLQHGARDGVLDDGGHRAQPRQAGAARAAPRDENEPATLRAMVTTSGWITPCTRIEAASVSSASGYPPGLIGIRRDRVDIDIERGRRPLAVGIETTSQAAPS